MNRSMAPMLLVAVLSAAPAAAQEPLGVRAPAVVITGGTLIDGNGGAPVRDRVIVIRGNRIARIGDRVLPEDTADAFVIDARGQFIIPGLFDAHVHNSRPGWGVKELERNLLLMLANGVTSAFDVGGDLALGLMLKRAVHEGRIAGPRMFLAGPILHAEDGMASARTPAEMSRLVDVLAEAGADLIKFYTCLDPPLVAAAIDAAHARGIPISGHHGLTSPLDSARRGLDIVHHAQTSLSQLVLPAAERERASGRTIEERANAAALAGYAMLQNAGRPAVEATAAPLAASKAYLVSTLNVNRAYIDPHQPYERYEAYTYLSDVGREWWDVKRTQVLASLVDRPRRVIEDTIEKTRNWLHAYWSQGGRVIAGTDAPTLGLQHGFSLQAELERIEKAGIPPVAVLMGATKWAAESVRRGADLGTVEVGRLADLLVLEGDPLADIRNTRRIRVVIKDGQIYDPNVLLRHVLAEDGRARGAREAAAKGQEWRR